MYHKVYTITSKFYGPQKINQLVLLKNTIETQNSEIIAYPKPLDLKVTLIAGEN